MSRGEIGERISDKLGRARAKLTSKLEAAQAKKAELQPRLEHLAQDLERLQAELETLSPSDDPTHHARLEVRRERLLAKRERLRLRQEVLDAKIEGYEAGVAQLKQPWMQAAGRSREKPPRRSPADVEVERRKILDMVADGKITAEEASHLLEALGGQAEPQSPPTPSRSRVVRVRVTDLESNQVRVNIKLPLGLIRAALRKGRDVDPDIEIGGLHFDTSELEDLLRTGVQGPIINVEDGDERVEVLVE